MGGKEMLTLRFCCLLWVLVIFMLSSGGALVMAQDIDEGGVDYGGAADAFAPNAMGGPMVPAMFVFGDSLIDNGNNNDLTSFAKANYFPYGIDFNGGPTGRFSNGYTMVDTIAELLGLPLIPAFSEASNSRDQMAHGVNFASAAAGILDDTGRNFVGRIPFNEQIQHFEDSLDQITGNLAAADAAKVLSHSLFTVGMGSNDYLNNYLMPNYQTRNQYNGQQFADLLSKEYTNKLTRLYNLGARKFVLAGIGRMGCIPSILAQGTSGRCSEDVNQLVLPFNDNIRTMINNLSINLPGSKFVFIDINNMFQDLLANSRSYGFRVLDRGCCGIGRNRGQITCLPFQTPCRNRNEYVFWDAFHPTEVVNVLMGRKAFSGTPDVVHPINIQQLASI
ncbi:SGNH hydrolase-type esterase domain-containing protein [Artemisia annua]|uniref:SGNH hydrolase-type esterase domain-containing protein n=1 Tax=Artemisia annua TaxID=35608 RepID=A0A2U1NKA6_ARTAN|nr:SGNH hydrolase-type esterase domain-containing protein [Artemisia annua]